MRTPESHLRRLWASEAACPLGSAGGTSAEDGRGDEAEKKLRSSSNRRLGETQEVVIMEVRRQDSQESQGATAIKRDV